MRLRLPSGAAIAAALLASAAASARPLALDLGLPALSLFGQVPPPPVVLPPGPPLAPGEVAPPGAASHDALRLKDGRTLEGKILYPVQNGLLFHDAASGQTYVVPFADIVDLQQSRPELPGTAVATTDRRLFLEAQIREVKLRYEALSLWPAVEELCAGALGIGGGVLLYVVTGGFPVDVVDGIFAAILAVTGAVSLAVGVAELASVVKRESELKDQLEHLQVQLGQLRSENLPAPPPPLVAIRF